MSSRRRERNDARPAWNPVKADKLIGKHVLIGITRLASDGVTVKAQSQYRGKIVAADEVDGFKIECEGAFAGKIMTLPADLRAFRIVDSGERPEIVSNWTIVEPAES